VCTIINITANYRIAQNSGGEKLWRISDFKVLARKTLANARDTCIIGRRKTGESEGKLPFGKQKLIIIGFWLIKII